MSQTSNVRAGPPLAGPRGAIRWLCTNNPFYVLSAGLFLVGLWLSFGQPPPEGEIQAEDTWALMSWLAGYTLLLAGTAYLLVRYAKVWDDARTVLLLVVLMFLATSVTFDEVLIQTRSRGVTCYLLGLGFAVAVSEVLLRGIRLVLPALFRVPYYLILALFFVYPLALPPLVRDQHNEPHMWGLFGFTSAAGVVFLTLLPAIRRGSAYVRNNGSPWPWPLYPWTLFGLLGLAVPARAFLLCWSMHLPEGGTHGQLIFGPYFLVPFGLAVAVLLLEIGLQARSKMAQALALLVPVGLAVLASVGHRPEPLYQECLSLFTRRLGGTPLFWTVALAAAFYGYAAVRRVPLATAAMTAALVVLAAVNRESVLLDHVTAPQPAYLLAAALVQLILGIWHRDSWHCLAGGLLAALAVSFELDAEAARYRGLLLFHLVLITCWIVGAAFNDSLGRTLRAVGAMLATARCLITLFDGIEWPWALPTWSTDVYVLVVAAVLVGYGVLLRHPVSIGAAGVVVLCWLGTSGWDGYRWVRRGIQGLDYIVGSLAAFVLAVVVSLAKAGLLFRRWPARAEDVPLGPD